MSECRDLTRWNRAGQTRFRYVDGNAVEYLEILRQQLVKRFGCDLRIIVASEGNPESDIIGEFQMEFEAKTRAWAVLIVRESLAAEKWTVSGFSDAGVFRTVVIDTSNQEFSSELTKDPIDESRIIELAALSLGRRHTWLTPAVDTPANEKELENETLIQRQARLSRRQDRILKMYHKDRGDWAWEITRTFARACHILTEHIDAYANEQYLGTATQWDHVRRLVEMLDYHPAPPASASTRLVIEAKASVSGLVKKGWQVKYKPPEGGDKVIFETLDDIEIDSALNELYPKDWNKSQADVAEDVTWVKENGERIETLEISSGDVGVLLHTGEAQGKVVHLADVNHASGTFTFSAPGFAGAELWPESQVKLLIGAKDVRAVRINGEGVVGFDKAHGLSMGDVISWYSYGWKFNEVVQTDDTLVRLANAGALPGVGDTIYRLNRIEKTTVDPYPAHTIVFPLVYHASFLVRESHVLRWGIAADFQVVKSVGETALPLYNKIIKDTISEIYVRYSGDQAIGATVEQVNPADFSTDGVLRDFIVDGASKGFRSGDWVIGAGRGQHFALQIENIEAREDDFIVRFSPFEVDQSASPLYISESLGSALRRIQVALDEDVLRDKTLGFFMDGHAKDLPVRAIQDIGEVYAGAFGAEATIQDLMDLSATVLPGISETRLRQFKTKAEMVLTFNVTEEARSLSGHTVYSLLDSMLVPDTPVSPVSGTISLDRLYGPLQYTLRPKDFDRNEERLDAGTDIELDTLPSCLTKGRTVMVQCAGSTLVSEVKKIVDTTTIRLVDSVDPDTFVKADTRVYANVVLAGHGEGKPAKILGSGDAAASNQDLTLDVDNVTFIPDATKRSGVAAAIDVDVAGRVWEQVSTLKDSGPGDHHYTVRMTEEGYVNIQFGDGDYGRRLPSGKNNIRVRYRVGSGLSGNVPAGALEKPVNPHPLIKAVRQPLKAAGGGDMEDTASLRGNAPSTLLAFERAVSLSDFSHLAAAQSSVWQAQAYSQVLPGGRTQGVRVVIVPADGVHSSEINDAIQTFLQNHALPGVQVSVESFVEAHFSLAITVRVKIEAFIAEDVEKAVAAALASHFSLKNRKLGAPLYLSEVTKIVESVQGVENSICVLNEDETLQLIRAANESTVITLDTDAGSTLTVTAEEYLP